MSVKESAQELFVSQKVAMGAAAGTTGTGLGTVLNLIPDDIGKLATVVGLILSVILIRVHLIGLKKAKIELEMLKQEKREKDEAAEARRSSGQPLRRSTD